MKLSKRLHINLCRNRIIRGYKTGAKIRGIRWYLTEKHTKLLLSDNCYYCGVKPSNVCKDNWNRGDYIYNGIDRINNKLGYTKGNCVSCCGQCNRAKMDLQIEQFDQWINRLVQKQLSNNNIRFFYLDRKEDVNNMSGIGVVALGVEFPSKKCVMEWLSDYVTETTFENINHVKKIHSHEGKTLIVMGLPPGTPKPERGRRKK